LEVSPHELYGEEGGEERGEEEEKEVVGLTSAPLHNPPNFSFLEKNYLCGFASY